MKPHYPDMYVYLSGNFHIAKFSRKWKFQLFFANDPRVGNIKGVAWQHFHEI